MLTIRNEQLETLGLGRKSLFIDRVVSHLAAEYPPWYKEQQAAGARAFVRSVIELGNQHNIRGEWAVVTLAELIVEFGEAFERSPDRDWAVTMLAHPQLPDQLKLTLLSERLREKSGGMRIVEIDASQERKDPID